MQNMNKVFSISWILPYWYLKNNILNRLIYETDWYINQKLEDVICVNNCQWLQQKWPLIPSQETFLKDGVKLIIFEFIFCL